MLCAYNVGMGSRLRDTRESKRTRARIAKTLRRLRMHELGDIAEAAKLAGVGHMTWRRWEAGESSIPAERLPRLAKILNCTVMEILGVDARLADLARLKAKELEYGPAPEPLASGYVDRRLAAERPTTMGPGISGHLTDSL